MSASNPIRIDAALLDSAAAEASREHRTPPKQIEYWARLGRAVDGLLSRADIVALRAGLLHLKPSPSAPVDPDEVFGQMERDRDQFTRELGRSGVVYQAARERPGYLEAVYPDGRVVVGLFENGEFVAA